MLMEEISDLQYTIEKVIQEQDRLQDQIDALHKRMDRAEQAITELDNDESV